MPRKQYRADLAAASTVPDFGHITNVQAGDDDDFTFIFNHPGNGQESHITAMVSESSDYPSSHQYSIFADEDAAAAVASALDRCPDLGGRTIQETLALLSSFLAAQTATGGQQDPLDLDSDGDYNMPDSQDIVSDDPHTDDDDGDNEDWALEDDDFTAATGLSASTGTRAIINLKDPGGSVAKARADLRAAKDAGFKVGVIGGLRPGVACYISIACRIAKLGVSEEAQDAWGVEPNEYLILLMYFPHGYRDLKFFDSIDALNGRSRISFSIGVSETYKPRSADEAQRAFAAPAEDAKRHKAPADGQRGFRDCFISRPINALLNERFTTILKYRLAMAFPWSGAERYYNDSVGTGRATMDHTNAQYAKPEDIKVALPSIVTQDEISTLKNLDEMSFPLITMQYVLRHFVRCTEFCLVCHNKLESEVEAIKPYVCESPLCLYQYMSLGFGPSIEHEIITQPYVVDLLVSFCYAAAAGTNLSTYPDGLGLLVPDVRLPLCGSRTAAYPSRDPYAMYGQQARNTQTHPAPGTQQQEQEQQQQIRARYDSSQSELLFEAGDSPSVLTKGQWIVINPPGNGHESLHCRVLETHFFPTVRVSKPVILAAANPYEGYGAQQAQAKENLKSDLQTTQGWVDVQLHPYDKNMDDLTKTEMCTIILLLLDLLPTVQDMKDYLLSHAGASLSRWTDRVNPAALGILRWIIASNRSCIMQVDQLDPDGAKKKSEDRVQGVSGWLQFRFAMGAPDKEQRFVNSINAETGHTEYPTMFAWHGSPLSNWHSIIREGLHFNKTSHGRAYGHGCYHAKDFSTSGGYSGRGMYGGPGGTPNWRQSLIKITGAVALSEIVNAPQKFVSHNPYYVVAQLDWIQTRYLLVQPLISLDTLNDTPGPIKVLKQDPQRTPTGASGSKIALPITAIPRSRRKGEGGPTDVAESIQDATPPAKRAATSTHTPKSKVSKLTASALRKLSGKDSKTAADVGDDAASVSTATEDRDVLFDPLSDPSNRPASPPPKAKLKPRVPSEPCTAFEIKELIELPLTPVPSYATSQASKRLQKDFCSLLAVQEKAIAEGSLADLGWYVDPTHIERTSNLYQWIAELHSFPLRLPLAKDMKKADVQSVILEIRFPGSYPMSPPFVRVVRPRFLPFASGGGGHVTAGGSICAEFLTNDGWTVVSSIESVLLQVRFAMMSLDPKPARIESVAIARGAPSGGYGRMDYGVGEAIEAFKRACAMHGWKVPEGLNEVAKQGPGDSSGVY